MIDQFNTDKNISGTEEFTAPYITQITKELKRFSSHITRIEAHLSDRTAIKTGQTRNVVYLKPDLKNENRFL